jgi:hypothetical protein
MGQRIFIFDSRIDGLFQPRGVVHKEIVKLTAETKALAVATAPINKFGESQGMANRHKSETKNRGRYTTSKIENTAPYAAYVHNGTTGPIVSNNPARLMLVGKSANNIFALKAAVSGQDAQPWLERAAMTAARRRGVVR